MAPYLAILSMKLLSFSAIAIITAVTFLVVEHLTNDAYGQEAAASASGSMKFIGAGVAFGLAALGAGIAIGGVGAAGLAAITERPELRSQALVFTALGEAIAIYGIVVAIIILGQS
jgi:V/A-type H+/Na+-transporting ATPase subunit K